MLILACGLPGCSKKAEQPEPIRPVRAITLGAAGDTAWVEFPGEVRARVESRLGFRVGGKIIERKVDVGTPVRRGQVLMRLDPQDLQLAQRQAEAQLQSARSSLDLAQADLKRYRELHDRNFVSQAALDAKISAQQTAQAGYDQARAAYRNQSNQAGYAVLAADIDGVVTRIDAEAGQVVAAGTPVLGVAGNGAMDVVVAVPEDKVDTLRRMSDVRVRLWADPGRMLAGKVREVAPEADAATRTYAVKVALQDAPPGVRLGMTAYVGFGSARAQGALKVPLTALVATDAGKGTAIWVVERGAVRLAPVRVTGQSGNDILIAGDVSAGQTVVTAGVNLLRSGEKVTILGADPVRASAPPAAAGAAR